MPADLETTDGVGAGSRRRWEYPALVALGVAVALVLGLTFVMANSDRSSDAAAEQAHREAQVRTFLNSLAVAQTSNDQDAMAALVDPGAVPGVLEAETRRMTALAQLKFSDWGYDVPAGALTQEPATGAPAADEEIWHARVLLRYALADVDSSPTRKPVSMVFSRSGDTWLLLVNGATVGLDAARTPGESWHGPWEFGTVVTARNSTGHALVIGHPAEKNFVEALAADLDEAIANTTELWGPWWSERVVVMVAGSAEEFTALVGQHHDGASIAAVSVSDAVTPGSGEVSGQRVVFSPAAASRLTSVTRKSCAAARVGARGSPLADERRISDVGLGRIRRVRRQSWFGSGLERDRAHPGGHRA
ncbi:hypothetical protein [Rhodococcus sp. 27YEA15]|uniref:hypothetical protein n=1 Tax=Rhodococcus sp. 27YEA15 TaxID=3156259 RepID=UPI003C7C3273